MKLPAFMLKQLYRTNSLEAIAGGFRFTLQNPLMPVTITALEAVWVDEVLVETSVLAAELIEPSGERRTLSPSEPVAFVRGAATVITVRAPLGPGPHALKVRVATEEFGPLAIHGEDVLAGSH